MNVNNVVRTITIRGTSEGIDELTSKLGKLAGAQENVAVVSETSAKRVLSLEDAWKKQSLKLDEAARSQAAIARETKIADGALREGLVTQQQHAERLNLISQKYAVATVQAGKFATQTGLNRYEILNFSRQIQDVGISLAGGQSPFVVLAQQGSQIADIFQATNGSVRGFASQAIGWLGRFATSVAGAATGAFAIGAGALYAASSWAESQREIERALIGIGKRSGATVADVNQIARGSSTALGLSVDQARTAALEFVKTGAIYRDNIKAAADATYNFSIVTGQDAKEAAKDLAQALADPLEGADKLNQKLGFLDGQTRQLVISLASQNRIQEAQAILIRGVADSTQNATQTLSIYEKAWAAVGNAASVAKNAVGAALSPNTDQENLNQLRGRRQQLTSGTGVGLFNQLGNRGEIARLDAEIVKLEESLRKAAAASADDRFKQFSIQADDAVKALIPQIAQLEKLAKLQADIKRAQSDPNVGGKQGLSGDNAEAARSAELLALNMKNTREETDRANQVALQLMQTYNTSSREIANMRAGLADQLVVASAVGGQAKLAAQQYAAWNELIRQGKSEEDAAGVAAAQRAVAQAQLTAQAKEQAFALENQLPVMKAVTGQQQIQAQYQATINQMTHDGVPLAEATAVATAQRANSLAQVNAEADRTLKNLQQEAELIRASSAEEENRIRARHTYQDLIDKGVDSTKAQRVATQQLANAEDRRRKAEDQASEQALRNIRTECDAWKLYEQRVISWSSANIAAGNIMRQNEQAAEDAAWAWSNLANSIFAAANAAVIAKGAFVPFSAHSATDPDFPFSTQTWEKNGSTTQFNPSGYASKSGGGIGLPVDATTQINQALAGGGSGMDAFSSVLSGGLTKAQTINFGISGGVGVGGGTSKTGGGLAGSLSAGAPTLDTDKLAALDRLIATMSKDQQVGATQRELDALRGLAPSLERDEAINRLSESLKQLTDATNQNTSATQAMTDVLSPLYSSDPRTTHLGFRAFAGGGIMTPYGELPIHKYDGGGIARSPQVSIFGEGSMPEAYVPVPNGRIPVEMSRPANNNQAPQVTVNNHFHGPVTREMADQVKKTGYQNAQQMRRMLG